jgi:hypothetical protein
VDARNSDFNEGAFYTCRFNNNGDGTAGDAGVHIEGSRSQTGQNNPRGIGFFNPMVNKCNPYGIDIRGGKGINIINLYFEGNTTAAVNVDANVSDTEKSHGVAIYGGWWYENTNVNVRLAAAVGTKIQDIYVETGDATIDRIFEISGSAETTEIGKYTTQVFGTGAINTEVNDGGVNTRYPARTDRGVYEDLTGSRSLDTWYQNTTGYEMEVVATVATSAAATVGLDMNVNDTDTANRRIDRFHQDLASSRRATVRATVPPGQYYQIESFGDTGSYSLLSWFER